MPEVAWTNDSDYNARQPFEREPLSISRVVGKETNSLLNPLNLMEAQYETSVAGFKTESPFYAYYQMISAPAFEYDPSFDWSAEGENSKWFHRKPEAFLYAASREQWKHIELELQKELDNRETLHSHGLALAIQGSVFGGMVSPTIFMPFVGQAKGAKGVAQAFALAATAAGADELALHGAQELRTTEESILNIAGGTLLGGLMGTTAVFLRAGEKARLTDEFLRFLDDDFDPHLVYKSSTVGSLHVPSETADPGGIKRQAILRPFVRDNPHGRLVTDEAIVDGETIIPSPTARRAGWTTTTNGLKSEGNVKGISTVEGGDIESRIPQHLWPRVSAAQIGREAYRKYLGVPSGRFQGLRTEYAALRGLSPHLLPPGKLTFNQFGEKVSESLRTGDVSTIPEVMEAAKGYRALMDHFEAKAGQYYRELQDRLGPDVERLFTPRETRVDPTTGKKETYWPDVYDPEKIQGVDFDKWIEGRVDNMLDEYLTKEMARFKGAVAKFEKDLADKGTKGTKAFQELEKMKLAEIKRTKAQIEDRANLRIVNALRRDLERLEDDLRLTRALVHGEDERGLSMRLTDELYDSIGEWSSARITRKGGDTVDLRRGTADFKAVTKDIARHMAHNIRGSALRAADLAYLPGRRGAALRRTLDDAYEHKAAFLVNDPELVSRVYTRKMGPDLELYRAFGDVNAANTLKTIQDEYDDVIMRVAESVVPDRNAASRLIMKASEKVPKGQDFFRQIADRVPFQPSPAKTVGGATKHIIHLRMQQARAIADLRVLVQRLRHQRGLAENADSWLYRFGRNLMNFNTTLMMGGVMPSSLPDAARPLAKFHARTIVTDGVFRRLMDTDLYNAAKDQLHLSGGALESFDHTRTSALADIAEPSLTGGGRIAKGLEWGAHKMGVIGLFEAWTVGMKRFTGNIAIGEISRGIRILRLGDAASKADRQMYTEMLSSIGLSSDLQKRIWKEMAETPNGGTQFGENWLPNLESWTDMQAADAYKAALVKIAEFDTIVTPGIAKPTWMDQNIGFRMAGQFRSFTAASHHKVLLAMAQDASLDMNGLRQLSAMSMGLGIGAMTFYTRAAWAGGEQWERAKNASIETVMDEAIDRSGLFGWFAEGLRFTDLAAPGANIGRFGDAGVTRRSTRGLWGFFGGPSHGTADKLMQLAQDMDEPTVNTIHRIRQLTLYNQVFYLQRLMNQVEDAAASASGVPERRKSKTKKGSKSYGYPNP